MRGAFSLIALGLLAPAVHAGVDFQRQVRPILSENCFLCHGPDAGTRMAGLRLDLRDEAFAPRKNGAAIVPNKPEESLLIKRIFADKPAVRMPPPMSHRTLTGAQKETLKNWIAEGAQWKEQWAFVAPVKAPLPEVKDAKWPRNEIDRFILAKLESTGLQPAEEADRRTLVRRVTLDLTGLPPTPAEVAAYVSDRSSGAYEKVVDRLLKSPRYGEHRARYWLDAARYADSQGLHIDNYREMWPYRDWVINAFNGNMPFDRFTVEQLAGDLLPSATLDQQIASGFQRCNVTTNEGGAIPDEVAAMYAKDRADTTAAVWMGLTVGCATCHDHKFDPIAQKEMYALTAFYRNTTQHPLDGNVLDTPPTVVVPLPADRARYLELSRQRATLQRDLQAAEPVSAAPLKRPSTASSVVLDVVPDKVSLENGAIVGEGVAGSGKAIHFADKTFVSLPHVDGIDADKPFTIAAWVYLPNDRNNYVIASQLEPEQLDAAGKSKDAHDHRRGWILNVSQGGPSIKLTGDNAKYLIARPDEDFSLTPDAWHHVIFTYDGSRDRKGLDIYVDGKRISTFGDGQDIFPLTTSIRNAAPLKLGNDKKNYFTGGAIAEFRILSERADQRQAEELSLWNAVERGSNTETARYNILQNDPRSTRLQKIEDEREAIARRGSVTFVMRERTDQTPIARVLNRGQYDQPKEEVTPNVLAVLPPMPASFPRNRLGLAEWLTMPTNPLTARVTVNRFWQEVFGTGIVKTADDFGSQGEQPSHPELLDWLAVHFRDSGWDVKRFFRLMVTSATYRQSALTTDDKLRKDPGNRLVSRGPRYRMDGEMVRDYALAVSGLLTPAIGGPSVKPYQPANVWETVGMEESNTRVYHQDSGDKLYRRSMYTFWKRSAPPASMDIFNAPSREVCTVRRERTDTPLQALVTMDDPQFVEAARSLAQNAMLASHGKPDREFDFMASRLLGRSLNPTEKDVVARSYHDYLTYYDSKPLDAAKLLSVGESKSDPQLSKAEFAAMTMVANEMLNLDEVLVK